MFRIKNGRAVISVLFLRVVTSGCSVTGENERCSLGKTVMVPQIDGRWRLRHGGSSI